MGRSFILVNAWLGKREASSGQPRRPDRESALFRASLGKHHNRRSSLATRLSASHLMDPWILHNLLGLAAAEAATGMDQEADPTQWLSRARPRFRTWPAAAAHDRREGWGARLTSEAVGSSGPGDAGWPVQGPLDGPVAKEGSRERRGWDSNPRRLSPRRFSRPEPSTTRPPLQGHHPARPAASP
jgi:hypothetical protein